jgi:hypothetical protein
VTGSPEKRNRAFFATWSQVLILFNLTATLLVHFLDLPLGVPCIGLAFITAFAAAIVCLTHLGSKKGMRSREELGLPGKYSDYETGDKGYPPLTWVYQFAIIGVVLFTGLGRTPESLLALSSMLLLWAWAAMLRKWPADLARQRGPGVPRQVGLPEGD